MAQRKRKKKKASISPLYVVLGLGGLLLIVLVVGLLVAKSSINSWLRGEGFQNWLTNKASEKLNSEVTLAEMKWQGKEVYANQFLAKGYKDAGFSSLRLDGVRAVTGGSVNRAYQVPEITVNRLAMEFSDDRLKRPASPAEVEVVEEEGLQVPAWLAKYVPNRVEIDTIRIDSAMVDVKNSGGGSTFQLRDVAATVVPDFSTGMWEFRGKGGRMRVPDQPEVDLRDLGLRWKEQNLFIDRCNLGIYEDGHIDGAGEISFAEDGLFDLELQISGIEIDELVEGEWKDRLNGTIHGPVSVTGRPGALVYEGTLNVTEGIVESIPALNRIAEYTRMKQFNRLVLSEAKADFKKIGDRTEIRKLVLQSDGLVRVEGDVNLVGEGLQGSFQIGVTPGTMRWIPGAERLVFTEQRDGFLWAPMTLAGTVQEPKEDLSARLIAAAGEALIGELPQGVIDGAQKLLGPDGNSEDLIKQGKGLLDMLTPFLKAP